ncbi:MAG: Photosystem I reaction center subunit III [Synechococcus sp.]
MAKLFTILLTVLLFLGVPQVANAEGLIGLNTCSDVPAFTQRQSDRISALEAKLSAAEPGSTTATLIKSQIAQTNARFDRYSSLLCGEEGLPHLVTDGRLNHAGEFIIPGLMFLYVAGFIGWAGRSYLIAARESGDATTKEIIIDLPMALAAVSKSVAWPALAFAEISSGAIREDDKAVPISPR